MKQVLSRQEIDQRVAVLKRFKALLQEQRKKFSDYLVVLETQERSIHEENIDALVHHTELEQSIIGDIFTIQKVIDPIEEMYRLGMPDKDDTEVVRLKSDLNKLQSQVMDQNQKKPRAFAVENGRFTSRDDIYKPELQLYIKSLRQTRSCFKFGGYQHLILSF